MKVVLLASFKKKIIPKLDCRKSEVLSKIMGLASSRTGIWDLFDFETCALEVRKTNLVVARIGEEQLSYIDGHLKSTRKQPDSFSSG